MPRAIVLAGGQGTVMAPYATVLPKPLVPVGDRSVLDIVLRQLRARGFRRVTMATGELAELIEAFFGDGSRYGLQIDYVREDDPLGTAGVLTLIEDLHDDVLVMNGDVLTDLDYAALLDWHRVGDAVATVAAQRRVERIPLGVLGFDDADGGRVTSYDEKPELPFTASMGVYCFSPRVMAYLEPGVPLDFPDLVERLLAAGERVRAWPSEAIWLDLGVPEDYERAQETFPALRDRLLPADPPA